MVQEREGSILGLLMHVGRAEGLLSVAVASYPFLTPLTTSWCQILYVCARLLDGLRLCVPLSSVKQSLGETCLQHVRLYVCSLPVHGGLAHL
jgi:hypothetical protein